MASWRTTDDSGQSHRPLRACPVCGERSGTVLGRLSYALFDDLEISGEKTLIRCAACGMLYDDVAFTETQLREYYRRNEHYAASNSGGTGGLSDDNKKRYDRIIDALHAKPGRIILDVGCGQGGFVARCRERGLPAAGIEPSEKSRTAGRSAGLDVYASLAEFAAGRPKVKTGAVVLSHVLEHLLEPLPMIKELARSAPDALVYMEVPDAASYLAPQAIRWHEMYFEHLNHFSRDSLSCLAEASGIEALRSELTPFSRDQADVQCLLLVGRFGNRRDRRTKDCHEDTSRCFSLPPLPDLPRNDGPVALWGLSQYAMLLMGSLPSLGRVSRLFDASPAKIGRKVRGVAVEDARNIRTLPRETTLLLPRSPYSHQMREELERSAAFTGRIVEI